VRLWPKVLDSGSTLCDNRRLGSLYNPLDKESLGVSVREALLNRRVLKMPPGKFRGAGIYAIYYTGDFGAYKPIADLNRDHRFECPIYVGKAVPKGSRKGGIIKDPKASTALSSRLQHHSESIKAATNLKIEDFFFRYLVVDDIWIPLGETYMIERFQPIWNKVITGFGIKTPGKRRKDQYTSLWDMIHPGRKFVTNLGLPSNPKTAGEILSDVDAYLSMAQEEKAKVPIKEMGDPEEENSD
jgi:Eco29kI restriction endonuclease.